MFDHYIDLWSLCFILVDWKLTRSLLTRFSPKAQLVAQFEPPDLQLMLYVTLWLSSVSYMGIVYNGIVICEKKYFMQ